MKKKIVFLASIVFLALPVSAHQNVKNDAVKQRMQLMTVIKDTMAKIGAMAKMYASEVCVKISNEAVQIHGGYGYIKDFPVEKFYRDSKLCTNGEGTTEIQKIVISRDILGKK